MLDADYKRIFTRQLKYYMDLNNKNQMDLMNDLQLSSSTVSSWCTGSKMPRMGKIQMLADYFGVEKSNLIEDRPYENIHAAGPHVCEKASSYYTDPYVAKLAQSIYDNPELRILFDATLKASPEDLELITDMIKRLSKD